jgi:hypothetical protein
MKTSFEIIESLSQSIAHIYLRPSMHIGSMNATCSASSLDILLYSLHYQWAFANDRSSEFRDIVFAQRESSECNSLGFADAFRQRQNNGYDEDASRFVLRNWCEISRNLQVPLDDGLSSTKASQ